MPWICQQWPYLCGGIPPNSHLTQVVQGHKIHLCSCSHTRRLIRTPLYQLSIEAVSPSSSSADGCPAGVLRRQKPALQVPYDCLSWQFTWEVNPTCNILYGIWDVQLWLSQLQQWWERTQGPLEQEVSVEELQWAKAGSLGSLRMQSEI